MEEFVDHIHSLEYERKIAEGLDFHLDVCVCTLNGN